MREFLFGGKRIDNGEWAFGSYCLAEKLDRNGNEHCIIEYAANGGSYRVDPSTIGQYTGSTDKNGKKIFEGDIVVCRKEICGNWIDCCVEIGFVEMKHGAFGLHRKQGYYRPFKDWLEDYEYEVIGNIHDNPELLNGMESESND